MRKVLFVPIVLMVTALCASTIIAQTPGPPAGGSDRNLRDSASDLKGRSNELERVTRDTKKSENRTTSTTTPNFPQIKEDFEQIQIINTDVLQKAASSPAYQKISEAAAEIRKRALRLRSNLFTSEAMKKPKAAETSEKQELPPLITSLDSSIASFTSSPIFQNTNSVNAEDSLKAQKELERIIGLSERIALEADRLQKQD
jgi:hypothetical protein